MSGAILETFMECFENGRTKRSISIKNGVLVAKYETSEDKSKLPKLYHSRYYTPCEYADFIKFWEHYL